MKTLGAEKMTDVTPLASSVLPETPMPRAGAAFLWIGRTMTPKDLMVWLLADVKAHGWPDAFVMDNDSNVFGIAAHVAIRPPFWIIENTKAYYGLQLSPRAYGAFQVVRTDPWVEIEAYSDGGTSMLRRVAGAPWIASPWRRAEVVRFMDARRDA